MSKILGKNETGFGLLVESDAGYIGCDLNKDIINESFSFKENEPILINCILQKWGVKNKNGRIYPKDVLINQVNEYQRKIDDHTAVNECFTPDTKILTKKGWKLIKNISENEEILTLNRDTQKTEFQKITKKIYEDYGGILYHIKSNNIDIKVTPNHRFLIENNKGEQLIVKAEDLFENINNNKFFNGTYKILKKFNWDYNDIKSDFSFSGLNIKPELFYAFMGIYLSEGCIPQKDYSIQITQKKQIIINKIESLLNEIGFNYKKRIRNNKTVDFYIKNDELVIYLNKLGKASKKYIPNDLKNASSELLKILLEWFLIGDGRNVNYADRDGSIKNIRSVFSTSKKLIYDLNEILYKSGLSGNITIDTKRNDRKIIDKKYIIINGKEEIIESERIIKRINSKALFNLNFSKTQYIYLDHRTIKVNKINYNNKIVCVKVPNETIFVMRNGKALWTLNSDHPDSSNISLQNLSHMIKKMWWGTGNDQNILYGQLQIIVSPGFLKYGVCSMIGDKIIVYLQNGIRLGISSRGVGTLKEIKGENVVQADFELICFDLVSTPSTPGAYLFPNKENFNFSENIEDKKDIVLSESNIKIINILNKFLL